METIELREQVGCGVGDRTHRIVRTQAFPIVEGSVGFVELQIVHLPVARFEKRSLGIQANARHHRET